MMKWCTSLVMIAVLGGVFAGLPLHAAERECAMSGMGGMDCCATAQMQGDAPQITAARLCCALDCSQSGTTTPTGTRVLRGPQFVTVSLHPAASNSPAAIPHPSFGFDSAQASLQNSHPAYIRHLALLI
jgi:hypothetical protein